MRPLVIAFSLCLLASGSIQAAATCQATQLVVLPPRNDIRLAVGFPVALSVGVSDDGGSPVTTGRVVAVFSTGDPLIVLFSDGDGFWEGTLVPS